MKALHASKISPDEPFQTAIQEPWLPRGMREAPALEHRPEKSEVEDRYVLLINPFYRKDPHHSFGKHVLTPSLALTSVASATPPGWRVEYWDENLLQGPPPSNPIPHVVGITVHLTFARRAYELAAWYRSMGAIVVFGGLHMHSCLDEALPHADALAVGDGVELWPRILNDIEKGTLQHIYNARYRTNYRDEPSPHREILPKGLFLTTTSLIATRGCHNRCGFCYLSTGEMRIPRATRDVAQIVEEFEKDRQPYGVFTDNNLGSDHAYLRALCRGLKPLNKIWSSAVSLDATDDPELVREMAEAGCTGVFIGFETLSEGNLAGAHKRSPRPADYAHRVALLHDYGIQVNGSFVLGFDEDRKDSFAQLASWIEENRLECATFHILTPYPGTPLFRQMESENRLLHRNWDLYDTAHVVFRPRHMTPEELMQGYAWLYQRLFSPASIWRRRPADARSVLPYLVMSCLYKKSNWLWYWLIRFRLVHAVWGPIVELSRRRHERFRRGLATLRGCNQGNGVVPAGV